MAARFVVALALVAVCSSNPVLINGVVYRDGRAYSIGQAYNSNGGASVATANINGDNAQAYGSSTGSQLSRDGLAYPGQAIAQAQTNDFGASKAMAQANNGPYYPVPAPARIITYEQNFPAPAEVAYVVPGTTHAHSSAFRNGVSDSSITSATSNNGGVAQSSANTGAGSYGATSSNAKTYGQGHAASNAVSGYGARTAAESQGQGSASSVAQTNGGVVYQPTPVIVPVQEFAPAVVDAKSPIFHTAYVPVAPAGSASSTANVVGSGNAAANAAVNSKPYGRTISWRFGTLYDAPAANSAQAQANTYGHGIAKSHADTHGHGYGSANANADVNSGYGVAKSAANVHNAGSAIANADVNSAGYGAARSTANTYNGSASSAANSDAFGHAKAAANTQQFGGSRTHADAYSNGHGSALSSARATPVSTAYRVASSQANSYGAGHAHAKAQTA